MTLNTNTSRFLEALIGLVIAGPQRNVPPGWQRLDTVGAEPSVCIVRTRHDRVRLGRDTDDRLPERIAEIAEEVLTLLNVDHETVGAGFVTLPGSIAANFAGHLTNVGFFRWEDGAVPLIPLAGRDEDGVLCDPSYVAWSEVMFALTPGSDPRWRGRESDRLPQVNWRESTRVQPPGKLRPEGPVHESHEFWLDDEVATYGAESLKRATYRVRLDGQIVFDRETGLLVRPWTCGPTPMQTQVHASLTKVSEQGEPFEDGERHVLPGPHDILQLALWLLLPSLARSTNAKESR
jgi:hypothetical protein